MKKVFTTTAATVLIFVGVGLLVVRRAQTSGTPERLAAVAVDTTRGGTTTLEIAIDRWSTDAERDRLQQVLLDKGAAELLDVLKQTIKVGFIRETSSIGWDLYCARRTALPDGGERIVVATDRPIGVWEASHQPRPVDYRTVGVSWRERGA